MSIFGVEKEVIGAPFGIPIVLGLSQVVRLINVGRWSTSKQEAQQENKEQVNEEVRPRLPLPFLCGV